MRIAILGATGTIGRALVEAALARGHSVTAQTRSPDPSLPPGARIVIASPLDRAALGNAVARQDVVIYALGFRARGHVTFFSESTRLLLDVMAEADVPRLIAVTGVGAGETRGHGGWFYDRVIFPLFTRDLYADKDRQEQLIRASATGWTILRPAPFKRTPGTEPFHALTVVKPGTRLSRVTPQEVAGFALDCAEQGRYMRQAVFFGHGVSE